MIAKNRSQARGDLSTSVHPPPGAPRSSTPIPAPHIVDSHRLFAYADLSISPRYLNRHLSHISIDTGQAHNRTPSHPFSIGSHLSHGPLSLTADRYRGAVSQPRESMSVPRASHRRKPDLSIDTTLSLQWNAPLLRRGKGPSQGGQRC